MYKSVRGFDPSYDLHDSQSRKTLKYGHEYPGTRNQSYYAVEDQQKFTWSIRPDRIARLSELWDRKIWSWVPTEHGTKNGFAGEGQQELPEIVLTFSNRPASTYCGFNKTLKLCVLCVPWHCNCSVISHKDEMMLRKVSLLFGFVEFKTFLYFIQGYS